ncbi:MAG: adenosylmethionine--8-amino-7-oxononanoate transaminase [Gemmatimonadales bacterium]
MTGPVSGPSREELVAWDDASVWHPFTPHEVYRAEEPLMVVAGEGHYLIDADGTRYLDGVSSLWCNLFGHRRPEIDAAIRAQLDRIAHSTFLGNASAPAVRLAHRLTTLAPDGLSRVFFSDDGSTAVEVAVKMAYQYWQQADGGRGRDRTAFLALDDAYHGDTIGSVSIGGMDLFHKRYGSLLFPTIRAPSPHTYRRPAGHTASSYAEWCIDELERLVRVNADRLAAVVLEPGVQGAAGMIVQPEGFVRRVREVTRQTGTLLILDEVAVGFGRSGRLFASEREGVSPDFLCLAKGLTGGYLPMAATLTTERIFEAFLGPPAEGRTFFHGHTYTGNQLAAAAALATLDLLEHGGVLERLPAAIARLRDALGGLAGLAPVGDIRQYGLAAGIELVADRASRTPFPPAERRGMRVCRAARRRGVFLRPLGDVVVVMPPLTVTDEEIDQIAATLAAAIPDGCA